MVKTVGKMLVSFARIVNRIMSVLHPSIQLIRAIGTPQSLRADGVWYGTRINIKSYVCAYTKNTCDKFRSILSLIPFIQVFSVSQIIRMINMLSPIPFALSGRRSRVYRRVWNLQSYINNRVVKKYVTIVILSFLYVSSYASITLHITDMQRQAVKEVQVGEPFLLTVAITDDTGMQEPKLEGLQDLAVKRVGSRLLNINGKKSQEHIYQIRIDKKGYYTLGPAIDSVSGQRSSAVRIKATTSVEQQKIPEQSSASRKQSAGTLLRLITDKETVYVGQKIQTVLRFYAPDDEEISIEQVTAQDPVTISVSEKSGPKKGQQEIDGKKYTYWQWQWDMFAQEPGQLVIPSYVLDYAKHLPLDNYLSSWAAFFGPQYERKRIYSNALTLQVKPLPSYDKQVQAVGNFTRYTAQIQPPMAHQYEGMVLMLTLEGSGNIEHLQAPDLMLPDGFKWYASKEHVHNISAEKQQKTFEYIVQGLQPGHWEIPEQTFTFFDVEMSAYKELKTASLLVNIIPGNNAQPIDYEQSCVNAGQEQEACQTLLQPENLYVHHATQPIPLYIFVLFMLLPACCLGALYIRDMFYYYLYHYAPFYVHRTAYNRAQKEIEAVCKEHTSYELHEIFLRYVAASTRRPQASLTTTDIVALFDNSHLDPEKKEAARRFFNQITEIAYARELAGVSYDVCNHAMQWLHELERLLR